MQNGSQFRGISGIPMLGISGNSEEYQGLPRLTERKEILLFLKLMTMNVHDHVCS